MVLFKMQTISMQRIIPVVIAAVVVSSGSRDLADLVSSSKLTFQTSTLKVQDDLSQTINFEVQAPWGPRWPSADLKRRSELEPLNLRFPPSESKLKSSSHHLKLILPQVLRSNLKCWDSKVLEILCPDFVAVDVATSSVCGSVWHGFSPFYWHYWLFGKTVLTTRSFLTLCGMFGKKTIKAENCEICS